MSHESVWYSRPRKFGKGSRAWYVAFTMSFSQLHICPLIKFGGIKAPFLVYLNRRLSKESGSHNSGRDLQRARQAFVSSSLKLYKRSLSFLSFFESFTTLPQYPVLVSSTNEILTLAHQPRLHPQGRSNPQIRSKYLPAMLPGKESRYRVY